MPDRWKFEYEPARGRLTSYKNFSIENVYLTTENLSDEQLIEKLAAVTAELGITDYQITRVIFEKE